MDIEGDASVSLPPLTFKSGDDRGHYALQIVTGMAGFRQRGFSQQVVEGGAYLWAGKENHAALKESREPCIALRAASLLQGRAAWPDTDFATPLVDSHHFLNAARRK